MIPRLKLPITVTDGRFATVEQDSVDEVAQCVYVVLSYEEGSRPELPDFGIESQLFLQGGVSQDEIRAAVEEWEPRAEVLTESQVEGLMQQTVRVQVST